MKKRIKYPGKRRRVLTVLLLSTALTGCTRKTELMFDAGDSPKEEALSGDVPQESVEENLPDENITQEPTPTLLPARIFVDVCGAVVHPGVYELMEGSRVFQAVEAAGGMLPEAAAGYVNQAELLSDGQQLYFPTEEEAKEGSSPNAARQIASGGGSLSGANESDVADQASGKINLNTADETALGTLSGIGPSKARAIVGYREENGSFSSIEELMEVPGIKEGTFAKIKDEIVAE